MSWFTQRDFRVTHPGLGRNLFLAFIALIIGTAIFSKLASASEPSWTGCYFGGNLGYLVQTSRAVDDKGGTQFDVSTASDAATYGVGAGCDLRIGQTPVVVGIFGDIDWTNAGKSLKVGSGTLGDTDINRAYAIGGRAGFLAGPNILLYGTGGYANVDMTTTLGTAKASKESGYFIGAGAEAMLNSGWSTKLEYRFVDLGNDTMKYGGGPTQVADIDKNMHQVRLGIDYKFQPEKVLSSLDEPVKPAAKANKIKP